MTIDYKQILGSSQSFVTTNWKPVVLVVATVIIFLFIAFKFGTYNPQSEIVTKLVDQQIKVDKEKFASDLAALQKKYNEDIKQKDVIIGKLQEDIQISDTKYQTTKKQIEMLKKEMNNYVLPKNMAEAKNSLRKLGYNPF